MQREPRVPALASRNKSTQKHRRSLPPGELAQQLLLDLAVCRSVSVRRAVIPVLGEGGRRPVQQAPGHLSCMLIQILPHKDNDTGACTVQTQQWMRKSESPILVEDRPQIRSQCSHADGCARENRAER